MEHDTQNLTPRPPAIRQARGLSVSSPRRPTLRDLVKEALAKPVDANGEPVWAVAGYCGNERCETRWHEELVSTLAKLDPVPKRLNCPRCGRYLSPRGHAPYELRDHWPVTGEDMGCRFHPGPSRPRSVKPLNPVSAEEFARKRPKRKVVRRSLRRVRVSLEPAQLMRQLAKQVRLP